MAEPNSTSTPVSQPAYLTHESHTPLWVAVGVILGVLCGALHVWLQDPLLTPLSVLASTMIMGTSHPIRPWRWIFIVGLPVPIVTGIAVVIGWVPGWNRALIAGSVLAILVGCAGSIGGAVMRRAIESVFNRQK